MTGSLWCSHLSWRDWLIRLISEPSLFEGLCELVAYAARPEDSHKCSAGLFESSSIFHQRLVDLQ